MNGRRRGKGGGLHAGGFTAAAGPASQDRHGSAIWRLFSKGPNRVFISNVKEAGHEGRTISLPDDRSHGHGGSHRRGIRGMAGSRSEILLAVAQSGLGWCF